MRHLVPFLIIGLCLLAACSRPSTDVQIRFEATLGGNTISCADSHAANAAAVSLTDLRFYVSEMQLLTDAGAVPLTLRENGRWQGQGVVLIDLEDGKGNCENGTPDSNGWLLGTANTAADEIRGLQFVVGVPFALNHADPLSATAPLDDPTMHWHWRSGYKFFRAGIANVNDAFWVHLGSSGCSGTIRNIESCSRPNRLLIELPAYRMGDSVAVDIAVLETLSDLHDGEIESCSSGPTEPGCSRILASLGLAGADSDHAIPTDLPVFVVRPQ